MELIVTVDVAPSDRHRDQPLTRAQVERVVAVRERLEALVAEALGASDTSPTTSWAVGGDGR